MAFLAQKFRDIYFPYRIFTVLCISFLAGIFIASFIVFDFSRSWLIFLYLISSLLFAGLFNYFSRMRSLTLISFCLLALSLGASFYSFREWKSQVDVPFNKNVEVTGVIAARPQVDARNQKIVIKIQTIETGREKQKNVKDSKIIVAAPVFPEYRFGQILTINGEIKEAQNFSEFDYKGYLKHAHIIGEIKSPSKIKFMGDSINTKDRLYSQLYGIVDRFENNLNAVLSEPHSSLAAGVLLGIKRSIPDNLMLDLQKTGLTHIIALSGFNITILMAVFAGSLTMFIGRKYTFLIGIFLVSIFVLMTGGSASVIRAAVFSSILLFGKTIGKRSDQLNLILLTALIMVIINPYLLAFDLGFQLSFLAFMGLLFLSPLFTALFEKPKFNSLSSVISQPLSETLGAQVAVFPLILAKFGIISIISPLANILVIWIVPLVMLFSFLAGIFAFIAIPLGQAVSVILWPCLEYIIKIVEVSSNLPFSSLKF